MTPFKPVLSEYPLLAFCRYYIQKINSRRSTVLRKRGHYSVDNVSLAKDYSIILFPCTYFDICSVATSPNDINLAPMFKPDIDQSYSAPGVGLIVPSMPSRSTVNLKSPLLELDINLWREPK